VVRFHPEWLVHGHHGWLPAFLAKCQGTSALNVAPALAPFVSGGVAERRQTSTAMMHMLQS
jgi:hypothetical protein